MKKYITLIVISAVLLFLSSCIFFQNINQPSKSAPNEIVAVTIIANTEGGSDEPYFGVCLPIGWTIPGDSVQCGGASEEVIYYDSSVSSDQEAVSPAPSGYYWWAGKGVPDETAVGTVFANLKIQTDNQLGVFSIDYMLGDSYNGVNYERSNGHLIEITTDPLILFVNPEEGYQNFSLDMNILGLNTHFSDGTGTDNVWLSKDSDEIYANSFIVNSNTSIDADFSIPLVADTGLWDINVETDIDGMVTKEECFNILPAPPIIVVNPDSLVVGVLPGTTRTKTITIGNEGEGDLLFNIVGGFNSTNYNYALLFDGLDDYVNMGYDIVLANGSFTLEAWAKRSANGPAHIIWGQGSISYNQGLHVGFRANDVFTFAFYANDLNTPISYTDPDWRHWACTFDVSTKVRKIYRDGLVVANDIATDNYQGSGTFYIGTTAWFTDYFDGTIDEVRI